MHGATIKTVCYACCISQRSYPSYLEHFNNSWKFITNAGTLFMALNFLQLPVTFYNFLLLSTTSCYSLQLPVTFYNFLLLSTTSCYFLKLPVTLYNFLLLSTTSCYLLQLPVTLYNFLLLSTTSCYFLQLPVTLYNFLLLSTTSCYCLQLPVTYPLSGPNRLRPTTSPAFSVCVKNKILHYE
jgi:hypothetical protein